MLDLSLQVLSVWSCLEPCSCPGDRQDDADEAGYPFQRLTEGRSARFRGFWFRFNLGLVESFQTEDLKKKVSAASLCILHSVELALEAPSTQLLEAGRL